MARRSIAAVVVLLLSFPSLAAAQREWRAARFEGGPERDDIRADLAAPEKDSDQAIQEGWVFLKGEYLPPPYQVQEREGELFVNEHAIPTDGLWPQRGRKGPQRGSKGTPGWGSRGFGGPGFGVERCLRDGGLLMTLDSRALTFRSSFALDVLQALLSADDRDERLNHLGLLEEQYRRRSTIDWSAVLDSFVASTAVRERFEHVFKSGETSVPVDTGQAFIGPSSTRYGITVGGMALAVFAFGVLLQHRPAIQNAWVEVDREGEGFRFLPRYVLLVVLFALLDLLCTLMADQQVAFRELNPLASSMLSSPLVMTALKISATAVSAGILLSLRQYRGAQVASWWLCFLSTILMLRWVTVNSLFLA